ncbi:cutinase family protein [Aestuariimicrobium sp. Y1814]|uniref:cutinase family protein n=1 Tax=Aestuariimicrobium sp. Y1814 TaxID=3418742 RepID=UPI003DA73AFF
MRFLSALARRVLSPALPQSAPAHKAGRPVRAEQLCPTRTSRSLTVALAIALALTGALGSAPRAAAVGSWDDNPVISTQAAAQPCADFLFVGVRGSGEPDGFGPTVTGVRDGLAQRWDRSGTVRQVWLDYPAVAPQTLGEVDFEDLLFAQPMPSTEYFDSADVGGTRLAAVMNDSLRRCPTERIILAGFSQGAQVITRAMALTNPSERLTAAILMGNPSHYPGQNVRELSGSATAEAIGLGSYLYLMRMVGADAPNRQTAVETMLQMTFDMYDGKVDSEKIQQAMDAVRAEIPAASYAATYSICEAGDMVCDASQPMGQMLVGATTMTDEINRTRPVHLGYRGNVIDATLDSVDEAIDAADLEETPSPGPILTTVTAEPQPVVVSRLERPTWLITASLAGATLLLGFVLGLLRGRAVGRASATHAFLERLRRADARAAPAPLDEDGHTEIWSEESAGAVSPPDEAARRPHR